MRASDALLKAQLMRRFDGKCQICLGNPDCKANKGMATDIHEAFVSKANVSGWPDEDKHLIRHELNCIPICNAVNTGGYAWRNWKEIARQQLVKRYGAEKIQAWIDTLGLKTGVRVNE